SSGSRWQGGAGRDWLRAASARPRAGRDRAGTDRGRGLRGRARSAASGGFASGSRLRYASRRGRSMGVPNMLGSLRLRGSGMSLGAGAARVALIEARGLRRKLGVLLERVLRRHENRLVLLDRDRAARGAADAANVLAAGHQDLRPPLFLRLAEEARELGGLAQRRGR